jgi:predicted transport protein
MQQDRKGLVYILTNPSLDNYIKIGVTEDLESRLKALNNKTAIPLSYRVFATLKVDVEKMKKVEQLVHKYFNQYRAKEIDNNGKVTRSREFFSVSPEKAYEYLFEIADLLDLTDQITLHRETVVDKKANKIAQEAKNTSEKASESSRKTFDELRVKILAIDQGIQEEYKKHYVAYKINQRNFVDIKLYRGFIKVFLNAKSGELNDPMGLARDMRKNKVIGHHGNGDYEIKIMADSDIDYIMQLIKFSYERNRKRI